MEQPARIPPLPRWESPHWEKMMSAFGTALPDTAVELPKDLFGYEVLDYLGQGARSHIYVVSDPQTRQVYALKHVVRKTAKDDRFFEQLETEYEAGRAANHPGLRRSIALKDNRTMLRKATEAVLLMELFDGTPLDTLPPSN